MCNKWQLFPFCMIQLARLPSHAPLCCCCCVQKCGPILGRRHFGTREVSPLCADTHPLIPCLRFSAHPPTHFCLQCLFDVTSAERDRHHWVAWVAVLQRAIHACCGAHRVKRNKARPLFTSGTNHPDGTSINPPSPSTVIGVYLCVTMDNTNVPKANRMGVHWGNI